MAGALRNLMVRINADMSGMKKEMAKAQSTLSGFSKGIKGVVGGIVGAFAGISVAGFIKDATSSAMAVQGSTLLIERLLGDSAQDFENWAKSGASAFGLAESQALNFGSKFAVQVSQISSSTDDMKNKTMDLLKQSSVIASQSGYDMETVLEKISSGLRGETESIQDLGIQMEVSSLQGTDAFKKLANGKSWNQLSFQVQQQIRYFGFLEQATRLYGNEIADNTATKLMMFNAELQNLKVALGNAFLPILDTVLPILTTFVQKLADVSGVVASFFKGLFTKTQQAKSDKQTKTINKQTKSVGGLGKQFTKTGKEIKKATDSINNTLAGFDSLNILNFAKKVADSKPKPSTPSTPNIPSTGGGSGGGGNNKPQPDPFADLKKKAEEFGKKLKELATPIINTFVTPAIKGFTDSLKSKNFADFVKNLKDLKTSFSDLGTAFKNNKSMMDGVKWVKGWIYDWSKAFSNFEWDRFGELAKFFKDLNNVTTDLLNKDWGKFWKDFKTSFINSPKDGGIDPMKLFANFDPVGGLLKTGLQTYIQKATDSAVKWFKGTDSYKNFKKMWDVSDWSFSFLFPKDFKFPTMPDWLKKGMSIQINFPSAGEIAKKVATLVAGIKKSIDNSKLFSGIAQLMGDTVTRKLNAFIDAINVMIKAINKFKDKIPWGSKIKDIPTIKPIKLATGGITTGSTYANIGEAGKEAVLPLERNTGWMDMLASRLAGQIGGSGDVVINIGGREVGRVAIQEIKRMQRQTGKSVFNV
jgi:hypothetical protein